MSRETIALALQGAGAGLLGQGPQFQQQLAAQRDQERLIQQRELEMRRQRAQAAADDLLAIKSLRDSGDIEGALQRLNNRKELLFQIDPNADSSHTDAFIDSIESNDLNRFDLLANRGIADAQAGGFIQAPKEAAGTKEFETLTEGLTPEQKQEAKLIKLGLSARAVGSAIQTIAGNDLAELVGDASATIKQREKFGEATGASRAKTIDQGFDRITKIDAGIKNIDRAISLLDKGAGVGSIEKLLPSFRAASVALDNIQGMMALDVVGATTFGALSKGELDLAKDVALPTGLDTDELMQHLSDKKIAQEKLRNYFSDQIDFLDQGGTVAGFLRQKEREAGTEEGPAQSAGSQDLSGKSIEELIQMRQQAQ